MDTNRETGKVRDCVQDKALLKRCSVCKKEKPRDAFNKANALPDGLQYKCRQCQKDYQQANKERDRERRRKYCLANKIAARERVYKSRKRHKDRSNARCAVYYALTHDKIKRPNACECCGKECKPHAHHYLGYEKKHYLDIKWLCLDCHWKEDRDETD